jgi:hypothetical protein
MTGAWIHTFKPKEADNKEFAFGISPKPADAASTSSTEPKKPDKKKMVSHLVLTVCSLSPTHFGVLVFACVCVCV